MRARRRHRPLKRQRAVVPPGVDLDQLASTARYWGSVEHKVVPTPAGKPQLRTRPRATPCPGHIQEFDTPTGWLREALRAGYVGYPWDLGMYPRYAWLRVEGVCYEARASNEEQGVYKGYPLAEHECPDWLP